MIKTVGGDYSKSYVGYTNNIKDRIKKHNDNKGAKSTKGYKWVLVYKKRWTLIHDRQGRAQDFRAPPLALMAGLPPI